MNNAVVDFRDSDVVVGSTTDESTETKYQSTNSHKFLRHLKTPQTKNGKIANLEPHKDPPTPVKLNLWTGSRQQELPVI
ncbi:hypothetical protein RB1773 [Rhodopirellula baltica SH 1]|uniref:Uncharacterized protein n=1 Tax=Rhodopirellula baltica (strain DSM 10527 / NCIMB 13988 / SH1) TaxID=243090 RepID=Q7UWV1_RHOBA|nr:hypothetical protein RB1773 [Rhodopirellula baltica SH 1]